MDFPLAGVTAGNKNLLIGPSPFTGGVVGGLTPGGSTTIGGGLNAAFTQLPAGGANPRNILLVTDGLHNTPPMVNPTDTFPTDIRIDAIGYGTPASLDGAMLTTLATIHSRPDRCRIWKILFWVVLLIAIVLLLLWILK